ncbi:MAG: hypothetical protein GF333_01650 [Candidatus Omnitrophica bacterium]|nr:hypothetical protein [Candidatus Omnitrophota bacterium]
MRFQIENIGITPRPTLAFFLVHIGLGLMFVLGGLPAAAAVHSLIVLLLGVMCALKGRDVWVACIISYIMGAEVLWRMGGGGIVWEMAKYGVTLILTIALLIKPSRIRSPAALVTYFLLLLPAILDAPAESFTQWKEAVSFNLSGPLSLLLCGIFFSKMEFETDDLKRFFSWFLAPVAGVAAVSAFSLTQAENIQWGRASVYAASAGFGPNQVSSVLGTGAFFCVIAYVLYTRKPLIKTILLVSGIWFITQAFLTFSRGGVIQSILAVGLFFVYLIRARGGRYFIPITMLAVSLVCFGIYYLIPKLDEFTQGGLTQRYQEREQVGGVELLDTTGRWELVQADLQIFLTHPMGSGVGRLRSLHKKILGTRKAAHTEWTRMLAEHGWPGLLAIIALAVWAWKQYRATRDPFLKAVKASFFFSAAVFMGHAAMRLVLPGVLIGFLGGCRRAEDGVHAERISEGRTRRL